MDYVTEINDIKSKITRLETELQLATGEDKIFLQQSILELLKKSNSYLELFKQQNARQGNC